jgi:predicted enzyme related to lactoylglutathione lyase
MEKLAISIVTADPAKLAKFYSTVFGLEIKESEEFGITLRTTMISGVELCLVPNPPGAPEAKGVHQFHVHSKVARQIFERAKKQGCEMHLADDGNSAYIVDPAGFPWEIVQSEI